MSVVYGYAIETFHMFRIASTYVANKYLKHSWKTGLHWTYTDFLSHVCYWRNREL